MSNAESNNVELFKKLLTGSWTEVPEELGIVFHPEGTYELKILKCELKEVTTKKGDPDMSIVVLTEVINVGELANPEEAAPPVGAKGYFSFWGVQGISKFGAVVSSVIQTLDSPSPEATIQAMTGLEIAASIKVRVDRKNIDSNTGEHPKYSELKTAVLLG